MSVLGGQQGSPNEVRMASLINVGKPHIDPPVDHRTGTVNKIVIWVFIPQ